MFKRIYNWFANLFKAKEPEDRTLYLDRQPIIVERPIEEEYVEELDDVISEEPVNTEEVVESLEDITDTVVLYIGLTKHGNVQIADEFAGPSSDIRVVGMPITGPNKSNLHSLYKAIVSIPKETTDTYLKTHFIENLVSGYLVIGVRITDKDNISFIDVWSSSTSRSTRVDELLSVLDTEVLYNDNLAEVIVNVF